MTVARGSGLAVGKELLSNNATKPFLHVPLTNGDPAGIPNPLYAGQMPVCFNPSNGKMWGYYNSGWGWINQGSSNVNSAYISKSSNYTLSITDAIVDGDASGGAFSLTLPSASGNTGKAFFLKKIDSSNNLLTIVGVEGGNYILTFLGDSIQVFSTGSVWRIYASSFPYASNPVGSVVAWDKSVSGTPSLPAGWVEMNGQTLNDVGSPYHNTIIEDRNGHGVSIGTPGSPPPRFLRGAVASGGLGGSNIANHNHSLTTTHAIFSTTGSGTDAYFFTSTNSGGTGLTAPSILPDYSEVVWIKKVK